MELLLTDLAMPLVSVENLHASRRSARTLMEMMAEARARLQNMEISCKEMLNGGQYQGGSSAGDDTAVSPRRQHNQMEILQLQVEQLNARLVEAVNRREQEDHMFKQSMIYASAKSTANAVLHTLFDQAQAGKHSVLKEWLETGVIPTRDGLKHWKVDLRDLRNEEGATLLHVAVGRTMALEKLKVKLTEFLLRKVGFDPNVRDLFGRTPLHIAAMSNYSKVVECLLNHGCDPTIQDRSGLTALSSVRTLSRPHEDVVKLLATAEAANEQKFRKASEQISPKKALASALFLKGLSRFIQPDELPEFSRQTSNLLNTILDVKFEPSIAFDRVLRENVPMLFDGPNATQVAQLNKIFMNTVYWDSTFINDLKVEVDGYNLSFVSLPFSTSVIAGPTWIGVLLKMIQILKKEIASSSKTDKAPADDLPTAFELSSSGQDDVDMEVENERMERDWSLLPSPTQVRPCPPPAPTTHIQSPPLSLSQSPIYGDRASSRSRQAWHYAVLFKASTHPLPGTLTLKKGSDLAVTSENIAKYFPLEDRLLIGKDEYFAKNYDPLTQQFQLDRPFEGNDASNVNAYLSGSCSSLHPPFIKAKRILEREPGNQYEDQNSDEQELFQDYQFLDPESDYEVAVKLGPVATAKDAREIVDAWKRQCRDYFESKKCTSGLKSCEHYCPQRSGHSLCCETMAAIGKEIAKTRLGKPTFSRSLKARASLQKYQDRFKGKDPWPGSPSTTPRAETPSGSDSTSETQRGTPESSKASRSLEFS
uniref:Uncharacterized protein n=1 Tax=Globisporangium ultimum (strain ATCC 200006 / CBS 805.95 / DAOM BR144) TaxID=431595 RepID=K3WMM7_GLOUD